MVGVKAGRVKAALAERRVVLDMILEEWRAIMMRVRRREEKRGTIVCIVATDIG